MDASGVLQGWLRQSGADEPATLEVRWRGSTVAGAVAREFRRDLLLAGQGHGHYGFAARLRQALPPGPCSLTLHVARSGVDARMGVQVPELLPARPVSVEALLRQPPGWCVEDVLSRPHCLTLPAQLAAQGAPRFVDSVFRFALERWPSPAEARLQTAALRSGAIGPEALLVELLTGHERADMPAALLSPYHPDFPWSAQPERMPA